MLLLGLVVVAFFVVPPPPFVASRFSGERPAKDCKRVLFVGNSLTFTHAIPANTQRLANLLTNGRSLCAVEHASPGATLEWHWNNRDTQRLLEQPWDYVVLQEASDRAYGEPDEMARWVERFVPSIRRSGAQPLLYSIMSNRWDADARRLLRGRMDGIAQQASARLVPVDGVWSDLLQQDPAAAIFEPDQHHPGPYGAYSAALLFARCLVGPLGRPAAYILAGAWPMPTYRLLLGRPDVAQPAVDTALRVVESHARTCGT